MNLAALPLLYIAALGRHGALADLQAAIAAAVEGGVDRDEAVELVAELLDYLTPIEELLPGLVGELAEEALDGAIQRTAERLVDLIIPSPAKVAARLTRQRLRSARRAARKAA